MGTGKNFRFYGNWTPVSTPLQFLRCTVIVVEYEDLGVTGTGWDDKAASLVSEDLASVIIVSACGKALVSVFIAFI